ncbi:hypothetical protein CPB83DRAFT_832848 [Crepidotus variabilis]|uniref:Uncharacterized protein n=1 Tax=Crepidotus variabilis TaxID=179855 RepID=A0A9P6ENA1_9AGAR|nr:hypothetical protein CPB83DRAFT_832848 [Crepidotus variabilis]
MAKKAHRILGISSRRKGKKAVTLEFEAIDGRSWGKRLTQGPSISESIWAVFKSYFVGLDPQHLSLLVWVSSSFDARHSVFQALSTSPSWISEHAGQEVTPTCLAYAPQTKAQATDEQSLKSNRAVQKARIDHRIEIFVE